jgi:hypothetical protein
MKTLKAISAAAILALVLSVPTYAGLVDTPGCTPPPPPPPELNFKVDPSVPTATSSDPVDMSTHGFEGFADILWVLASIF